MQLALAELGRNLRISPKVKKVIQKYYLPVRVGRKIVRVHKRILQPDDDLNELEELSEEDMLELEELAKNPEREERRRRRQEAKLKKKEARAERQEARNEVIKGRALIKTAKAEAIKSGKYPHWTEGVSNIFKGAKDLVSGITGGEQGPGDNGQNIVVEKKNKILPYAIGIGGLLAVIIVVLLISNKKKKK